MKVINGYSSALSLLRSRRRGLETVVVWAVGNVFSVEELRKVIAMSSGRVVDESGCEQVVMSGEMLHGPLATFLSAFLSVHDSTSQFTRH